MVNLGPWLRSLGIAKFGTNEQRCRDLASPWFGFGVVASTTYLPAGTTFRIPGSCALGHIGPPPYDVRVQSSVCRVYVAHKIGERSILHLEAWLPDTAVWNGRLLGLGNAGLGGCIDYGNLAYGVSLNFATIGTDAGHNGYSGVALADDEVVALLSWLAVSYEAFWGRRLVKRYYRRDAHQAYYSGCSTGGRQGVRSASIHHDQVLPWAFDGILAGAPALDFVGLLGAQGLWSQLGAQLSRTQWALVHAETLRQCDDLDGVIDGIITDPDGCLFRPEALLCDGRIERRNCLGRDEVKALRAIYSPIHGSNGQLLYPRFDPGAEGDKFFAPIILGDSGFSRSTSDWWEYVMKTPLQANTTFTTSDIEHGQIYDELARMYMATWNGNLSEFRNRGGKLLMYHGRRDAVVPSGSSIRYYNHVAQSMSLRPRSLDYFFRLFLVPGMHHCGAGAPASPARFGQSGAASNIASTASHNALLALVAWVENGRTPDELIGPNEMNAERPICRYPWRSVYRSGKWICVAG